MTLIVPRSTPPAWVRATASSRLASRGRPAAVR